jgi:hypothetical protein
MTTEPAKDGWGMHSRNTQKADVVVHRLVEADVIKLWGRPRQVRQLGDVGDDAPCLVLGEPLRPL